MNNVQGNITNCEIYDMKGATFQRKAQSKILRKSGEVIPETASKIIYKDQDFLEREKTLKLSEEDSEKLKKRISDAVDFLRQGEIIDYSMLVIKFAKFSGCSVPSMYLYESTEEGMAYCIAIIDMLQQFGFSRLIEKKFKGMFAERASQVGIQSPEIYSSRMVTFLEKIFQNNANKIE